jgi:hypothetical protein
MELRTRTRKMTSIHFYPLVLILIRTINNADFLSFLYVHSLIQSITTLTSLSFTHTHTHTYTHSYRNQHPSPISLILRFMICLGLAQTPIAERPLPQRVVLEKLPCDAPLTLFSAHCIESPIRVVTI